MWVPQTKALYTGGSVNNFISGGSGYQLPSCQPFHALSPAQWPPGQVGGAESRAKVEALN